MAGENTLILAGLALIGVFIVFCGGIVVLASVTDTPAAPTPVPSPTPIITPTPTPSPVPTATPGPTPTMLPDGNYLDNGLNLSDLSLPPQPVATKNYYAALGAPLPSLTLEILNDAGEPYNIDNQAIWRDSYVSGTFRIRNTGTESYVGNIIVRANVSLAYGGGWFWMDNIMPTIPVAIPPGQTYDHHVKWQVPSWYNGAPVYDGAYGIQLELREMWHGRTVFSKWITPQLATPDANGGSMSHMKPQP